MYILFINTGGKCDIFFSAQFNNNSNKKNCPTHRFNPTHVGWVGLNFFLLTMEGWVIKFTQPDPTRLMHTLSGKCDIFFSAQFNNNSNKKSCPTHGFNWTHMGWVGLM